ncbi:MAG: phosphate acetyltransferase [Campylobacteraceae bacterium]
MKIKSMYIAPLESASGSLIISMGLLEILRRNIDSIAFFRPVIPTCKEIDHDIKFMIDHYGLKMDKKDAYCFTVDEVESLIADGKYNELIQTLVSKFKNLEKNYEFVICEGLPRSLISSSIDFDINIEFAKNISTPFIDLLNGKNKTAQEILDEIKIESNSIKKSGCSHFATFINRLDEENLKILKKQIKQDENSFPHFYFLPELEELSSPTVEEIKNSLDCKVLFGKEDDFKRTCKHSKVIAMTIENMLPHLKNGDLVITPGDRADIILGTLMANNSAAYPTLAGILLSGGLLPEKHLINLLKSSNSITLPILSTDGDTITTVMQVNSIPAKIRTNSERKIALAMGLFSSCVDTNEISKFIDTALSPTSITPIMFEYNLFEMARKNKKRIVLPESSDDRILKATEMLLRRDVVDIILLGDENTINIKASSLGIDISKATIINPAKSPLAHTYIEEFYELRKDKGVTFELAKDSMQNVNYFATMMVHKGDADGMVSGAIHTTGETIRPALQIIKTKPGISIISSVFFMCLDTKVLVYGDCAVNQDPNAEELAQIAISSAKTASAFGIKPKIAMLSYSTGSSGKGEDVDKVRNATNIIKEKCPELLVEGPIQYDAAIDPSVAKTKLPNSAVAGNATVFIFPDLNTGNNTYKAVQRSSGAVAVGPVLQGLKKPVNDLSRGCLVDDIVNTVVITAIQAGQIEMEK